MSFFRSGISATAPLALVALHTALCPMKTANAEEIRSYLTNPPQIKQEKAEAAPHAWSACTPEQQDVMRSPVMAMASKITTLMERVASPYELQLMKTSLAHPGDEGVKIAYIVGITGKEKYKQTTFFLPGRIDPISLKDLREQLNETWQTYQQEKRTCAQTVALNGDSIPVEEVRQARYNEQRYDDCVARPLHQDYKGPPLMQAPQPAGVFRHESADTPPETAIATEFHAGPAKGTMPNHNHPDSLKAREQSAALKAPPKEPCSSVIARMEGKQPDGLFTAEPKPTSAQPTEVTLGDGRIVVAWSSEHLGSGRSK